ncbi:MAG: protein kinase [Granulosicoccus sp.]
MSATVRYGATASARLARRAIAGNETRPRKSAPNETPVKSLGQQSSDGRQSSHEDSLQDDPARASASTGKKPAGKLAATPAPSLKPLDITVPGEIDRYTIGKRIGSGTCGVVHQALDNLLGRDVAIKLSPIGEAHISTGKVPGAQRAYQTEIVAAGRLTHPNIVTVFDAGQFEDLNYIVMEVVEGKSLKEYGKGKTPLPVHEALRVISECCRALDYSHQQGILHRDIKPANIMLGENGSVKLLDFGIAVGLREGGGLKRQGPTLGTPNYMSPEQILGRELVATSDFYSLATVLFELLTGRQLFKAKKVKDLFRTVVHQVAPRLHFIRRDLPEGLSDVIAKALEKKPHLRFQSGREMAEALQPYIDDYRIVEQRPVAQQRLIRQLQKHTFFLSFSDVEIARLLERVKVRTFSPNDVLINNNSNDRRLLIITDGLVRAEQSGSFVALIGEGECLGEAGFINGTPEDHRMLALTPVNALELSADVLAELPPKVHLHYYRHISNILVARASSGYAVTLDCEL